MLPRQDFRRRADERGLTLRTGQAYTRRYLELLLAKVVSGEINASFVVTDRSADLAEGFSLYGTFRNREDDCIEVVLKPGG